MADDKELQTMVDDLRRGHELIKCMVCEDAFWPSEIRMNNDHCPHCNAIIDEGNPGDNDDGDDEPGNWGWGEKIR